MSTIYITYYYAEIPVTNLLRLFPQLKALGGDV